MGAYVIICDGGRDKDGGYGSFLVIGLAENSALVIEHKNREPMGDITNNEAEYEALIRSLESVKHKNGVGHALCIISDSQLMVRQLEGIYDAKKPELRVLRDRVIDLLRGFNYQIHWVPRSLIVSALQH